MAGEIAWDVDALSEAVWSDWAFRIPTLRFAQARPAPTWVYEFRRQAAPLPPLRHAFHGAEMPFVRDDLDLLMAQGEPARELFGPEPPRELARRMRDVWVRFAGTGDPGWDRYEPGGRTTMVFDGAHSAAVPDAAGPERVAWTGRRGHDPSGAVPTPAI